MKYIPIIAGSRTELDAFLLANPWVNASAVVPVRDVTNLKDRGGLVLALPGREYSPSILRPRDLLEVIAAQGMQLVVLEQAAYQIRPDPNGPSIESVVYGRNRPTGHGFEGELP